MSLWSRITDALAALTAGEGLSAVFEKLRSPPELSVAFTIAVIALGAKMAKADGHVTRDEVMEETILTDLMEGLFYIAMADGFYHPSENEFLVHVAEIFGLSERQFSALKARFVIGALGDPYTVLGVDPDMPVEDIRAVWRQLVRDTHPDAMMARGVPEEAIKLAEKRLIDVNRAWEQIQRAGG